MGLDARYGITRNLNLDVSVNTDFAQVEADDQQVNLTRFSLFFPEKRRFFQERAAVFEVPLGFQERLFFSRRIGLVNRESVRIWGGARLIGRVGDWDVGFIDMQTDDHDVAPSENLGVLRVRRRVLNQFSYLGGIVTSRIGDDGSYNVVYGDGRRDAPVRPGLLVAQLGSELRRYGPVESGRLRPQPGPCCYGSDEARTASSTTALFLRSGEPSSSRAWASFGVRDYVQGSGGIGYGWRPGTGSALNAYSMNASGIRRSAETRTRRWSRRRTRSVVSWRRGADTAYASDLAIGATRIFRVPVQPLPRRGGADRVVLVRGRQAAVHRSERGSLPTCS